MSDNLTKDNLFRPKPSKAETKADATNRAARMMIETEAARQAAKTARLRKLRLAQEAETPAAALKTPKRRGKAPR
jgi:hypothetical protein